jgi:hypothetical protein
MSLSAKRESLTRIHGRYQRCRRVAHGPAWKRLKRWNATPSRREFFTGGLRPVI